MNTDFIDFVENMAKFDISLAPGYRTAMAIAKHPNVKFPNAAEVAFVMEIKVSEEFVNDPQFMRIIDGYVAILNNYYAQLCKDFPESADKIFSRLASKMTLSV